MNHRKLVNDAWISYPNARAEDGLLAPHGWRALRDTVLIPLGLFAALFLLALLMGHSAQAQTSGGKIAGSVKDATGAVIPGATSL
jgi:hypothetical protein